MKQETILTSAHLATPRAAAIAGILFAVLLITGLLLFRLSVRADPLEARAWLKTSVYRLRQQAAPAALHKRTFVVKPAIPVATTLESEHSAGELFEKARVAKE